MKCEFCDSHSLIHLCEGKIAAYHNSLTPEQKQQRHTEMMESLDRAIEAGRVLKSMGYEIVCKQKNIDYLESTFNDVEVLEKE